MIHATLTNDASVTPAATANTRTFDRRADARRLAFTTSPTASQIGRLIVSALGTSQTSNGARTALGFRTIVTHGAPAKTSVSAAIPASGARMVRHQSPPLAVALAR